MLYDSSLVLGVSSSLALRPHWRWQSRILLTKKSSPERWRYIVSAASDPTVTSRAGADRLRWTEPPVYLRFTTYP